MHDEATHRTLDACPELEQPLAQGGYLGACQRGAGRSTAQFLHQRVRRSGQQHSELIGEEMRAAGAVDLQAVVQLSR